MNKIFYIFWFIVFFEGLCHAQTNQAFFKNFGLEQGLPSEKIRTLAQDRDGFLWIGTNNGLARFDGYGFEVLQNNTSDKKSISSDNIVELEPASDGQLWVGHYEKGLDLLDTKTGKVILNLNEQNGLPDNKITKIWFEQKKQRVWIGTIRKMFVVYDLKQKKVQKLQFLPVDKPVDASQTANNSVYDIIKHPDYEHVYLLATNNGLGVYDERKSSIKYFYFNQGETGFNTNDRLRSLWLGGRKLYMGVRGGAGLIEFDIDTYQWKQISPALDDEKDFLTTKILPKNPTQLWVGSINKSLGIFDLQSQQYSFFKHDIRLKSSIINDGITDILNDTQGNTWIATSKGMSLYSPDYQHFKFIFLGDIQNTTNKAYCFTDDADHIYIGHSNTFGLPIWHKKEQKLSFIYPDKKPQESISIQRFAKDKKGDIWFVGTGKLYRYEKQIQQLREVILPKSMQHVLLHSLLFDAQNRLIMGTRFSGLYRWDMVQNKVDSLLKERGNLVHNRYVHELLFDEKNQLWASTERGISVIDYQAFKVKKNINLDGKLKVVYRMATDLRGRVWASTEDNGVVAFGTKNFELLDHITKQQGLPTNAVQHIALDAQRNLWIATQQGLAVWYPAKKEIEIFNQKNGLIENDLEASLNPLDDGKMIQGSDLGFMIFEPTNFKKSGVPTRPKIFDFELFNNKISINENVKLEHDQNFFKIKFSSLDFTNAERIKYAHRLVGVNQDWVVGLQNPEVEFSKVRHGDYVFEVKAAFVGTENWSDVSRLNINIVPPFYLSKWFLISFFLGICGLAYWFYQQKIERIKNEERRINEINKQLFSSELRALRSQMNPHFLYNCINSIKFYIVKNQPEEASFYLNKFSKLIRKILNNSQFEFISIEEEIQTLELYLEMEKLRFGDKMNFRIVVDEELEVAFLKIPTMLIQPFLENAIWHGLMHKPTNDGFVMLEFKNLSHQKIQVIITDNGVGRSKAAELKSKSIEKNKSMGMSLTQNRIETLNSINNLNISLLIEDLKDAQNQIAGTKVEIMFDAKPITD
jgi:ligand-binding sensor domain-containing protein